MPGVDHGTDGRPQSGGDGGSPPSTVCVVVNPEAGSCPPLLAESLARRSVTIRCVRDVYAAMGQLAQLHKRGSACFVVLCGSAPLGADILSKSLARYAPGAGVWEFDAIRGMTPVKTHVAPPKIDVAPAAAQAPQTALAGASRSAVKGTDRPRLRLAGEGVLPPAPAAEGEPTASPLHEEIAGRAAAGAAMTPDGPATPVLTSEELEMLLGEPPGEKRATGGAAGGSGAGA